MRGFLLYLAILCPIVLLNPVFWHLVEMQTGAVPVVYGNHDGTQQHALLGPKAPWPNWAITPDDSHLSVQSHFASAPGHPATGVGKLTSFGPARTAIDGYRRKLERDGWIVETFVLRTVEPTLPPQPSVYCQITARRPTPDPRALSARLRLDIDTDDGAIYWREAPLTRYVSSEAGPC